MDLMPAILLSSIPNHGADFGAGVAVNEKNSLIASVDGSNHCVRIFSIDGAWSCTAPPLVVGTPGTPGSAHGQLHGPVFACFVHRNGADTLLICDAGNDRIVEVTATGDFCRVIALRKDSYPFGIAYCGTGDVIAVSLFCAHAVIMLHYESGVVKPEVTIGTATGGNDDGQLYHPHGVTFTADARYILVADWGNNRVSKFSAASGAFIAHVATNAANGILYPTDVLQYENGSVLVAQGDPGIAKSVVCVGEDGVTVKNIIIPGASGGAFNPYSLSYSVMSGVLVKTREAMVFLLRDAWISSNRCAWLSAVCVR